MPGTLWNQEAKESCKCNATEKDPRILQQVEVLVQCMSAQRTPREAAARETRCKTNNPPARPREPSGDHRRRDGAGHTAC